MSVGPRAWWARRREVVGTASACTPAREPLCLLPCAWGGQEEHPRSEQTARGYPLSACPGRIHPYALTPLSKQLPGATGAGWEYCFYAVRYTVG